MNAYRTRRSGFTLVEILIVVIILGILAAIVIPQFTNASTEARESNLRSQVQTLRSQIALFKLQHKDVPPLQATFWTQMKSYSNIDGGTSATKTATHIYGPYYDTEATNPLSDSFAVAAAAAADTGWVYDEATGKIQAMAGKLQADGIFVE